MVFSSDDPEIEYVVARELQLLDPAVRSSPVETGRLLDPEFSEFGASGRVWDRASVIDMMATAAAGVPVVADEVAAARLAADVILLTYRTRTSLRSSIWRHRDGRGWQLFFHQGTDVPDA